MLPFYILFKGKHLWDTWTQGGPPGCFYNVSESGWMEAPHFIEWFSSVFLPAVKDIKEPKLLLLDGHASHMTPEVVRLAKQNDVHILCFPSHSTHITQPIDVGVLHPAKVVYRKIVEDYGLNNNFRPIQTNIFARLFAKVIESGKAFLRRHVVAGFEATGNIDVIFYRRESLCIFFGIIANFLKNLLKLNFH